MQNEYLCSIAMCSAYIVKFHSIPEEENIVVPKFEEAAGFYTHPQRSKIMSKIRGKNTAPELKLKKAIWAAGIRYKSSRRKLLGKPDIQLLRYKILIFIDGDFWHGYDWPKRRERIGSNRAFWIPKIERNMQRDRQVTYALQLQGYTVLRFWEHEIKAEFGKCLRQILEEVNREKDPLLYLKEQ